MTEPDAQEIEPSQSPVVGGPPLRVERLVSAGFRNLGHLSVSPGPRFNVVHGDNGAGKSNLIEAIHYLCVLSSFRGARYPALVAEGAEQAELSILVEGGNTPRRLGARITPRSRQLQLDGKRPRSIAKWQEAVKLVIFHPGHTTLTAGGPAPRRNFFDRVLEQIDPVFSSTARQYDKAIRSRNRLLKQEAPDSAIRAYDELLANAGAIIGRTRALIVEEMTPGIRDAFEEVIGDSIALQVNYVPRVEPDASAILAKLRESLPKDRARKFTADGPHGDDIEFVMGPRSARHHASQGQHRAMALAMKVAELHAIRNRAHRTPILLLDDVTSELDRTRNERLFSVLSRLGGQVFLTTTHAEFVRIDEHRSDFRVEAGKVTAYER